ncbi:hypothetical protein [Fimbriimonas ginsengisoli]|uniref:hypothetical protein n=1 Tax=Fimbriimonas ginsengisoli TaxID=1005039 RepID=UPI001186C0B4|nr:hypothetical protein [Fimbriimonas ginsengisoli]
MPPIELLNQAAERLGDLCQEVVFLGGAVVGLLLTEKGALPPRVTKDVDVAIEVGASILDLHALDRRLLDLGFRNDMEGPTCRYLHGIAVIDVIPVNPEITIGVNSWYPLAIATAWSHVLDNNIPVKVIDPVCFLGTKMTAFRSPSREYHDDIFLSRDFSDMVRVIDGRATIVAETLDADGELRAFLKEQFGAILESDYLEEAIQNYVEPGREDLVLERIRGLAGEDAT